MKSLEKAKERFKSKIAVVNTGCWEWQARTNHNGYGLFHYKGRSVRAHRFALEHLKGVNIKNLLALHTCDNPKCVNPDHLYAGTHKQNMCDMVERGRAYKGTNTNSHKRKCLIYGLTYDSVSQAADLRQVPKSRIVKFLKDVKNKDYIYLD